MNGSTSSTMTPSTATPDSAKHVNYTYGMVLGVDDFTQEFAYLSSRDQWMARDLIGYGTASGLSIRIEHDANGDPLVHVAKGVAVSPRGQMIRVTPDQCANLNKWLLIETNSKEVETRLGAAGNGSVRLNVVLCYRECLIDEVPIPGEPCRDEKDTRAASRIADDFRLELRFTAPDQTEEEAIRQFVTWLSHYVEFGTVPTNISLTDFEKAVRGGADQSIPTPIRIHINDACEYLRTAFRIWVTDIRPQKQHDETCLLLAQLDVPLKGGLVDPIGEIHIDEENRPFLVHMRMLQEWLLCGGPEEFLRIRNVHTFATLYLRDVQTIRAWIHYPNALDIATGDVTAEINDITGSPPHLVSVSQPVPGVNVFDLQFDAPLQNDNRITLRFDADAINEAGNPARTLTVTLDETEYSYTDRDDNFLLVYMAVTPEAINDHGALAGLADDDHRQYLPVDPASRALIAHLNAGTHKIQNVVAGTANNEALVFGQTAGGDLGGTYPNPTVAKIQGRSISASVPADRNVLTWNLTTSVWEPLPAQSAGLTIEEVAKNLPELPFATITRAPRIENDPAFRVWFHFEAGADTKKANLPELVAADFKVNLFAETNNSTPASRPFLEPIPIKSIQLGAERNTAILTCDAKVDGFAFLRFVFGLSSMKVKVASDSMSLVEWLGKRPVKWIGHMGDEAVTVFHKNGDGSGERYVNVAAGVFAFGGREPAAIGPTFGQPTLKTIDATHFLLDFAGRSGARTYIVKGTRMIKGATSAALRTFEVTDDTSQQGIVLKIADVGQGVEAPPAHAIMIEVSEIR